MPSDTYKLYRFDADGASPECVVISDQDAEDIEAEYGKPSAVVDIDGDATCFPCYRTLVHAMP